MDPIPDNLIISSSCDAPSYCENEFSFESLSEQSKHFVSLFVVGQVAHPMSAREVDVSSFASKHVVIDHDSSTFRVAIAVYQFIDNISHFARWLISKHFPIYAGAHWAFNPILGFGQLFQTLIVHDVRTFQHHQIGIRVGCQLFLHVFQAHGFVFKLANTAFLMFGLFPRQIKLKCGVVSV